MMFLGGVIVGMAVVGFFVFFATGGFGTVTPTKHGLSFVDVLHDCDTPDMEQRYDHEDKWGHRVIATWTCDVCDQLWERKAAFGDFGRVYWHRVGKPCRAWIAAERKRLADQGTAGAQEDVRDS